MATLINAFIGQVLPSGVLLLIAIVALPWLALLLTGSSLPVSFPAPFGDLAGTFVRSAGRLAATVPSVRDEPSPI